MTSRSRTFFSGPRLAALLLPAALAACQAPPGGPRGADAPRGPAAPSIGREEPGGAAPSPGALPSTADLIADPGRFKGLSGADAAGILGTPSFRRRDGDAQIWQYYGPSSACVLDLFLYPDQGRPRVAHAELRSRGTASASACLAAILDGKRG